MNGSLVLLVVVILLLMTFGRVVFRPVAPKGIDWALEVAFVRLDYPQPYRDVAQHLAAGLAEVVGMKIKQLRPDHNLKQIAEWSEDHIYAKDLITLFVVAFNVKCSAETTFSQLVELVAAKKAQKNQAAA